MPDKVYFSAKTTLQEEISLNYRHFQRSYQHLKKKKRKKKGKGVVQGYEERESKDNGEKPGKGGGIGLLGQRERLITGRRGEGKNEVTNKGKVMNLTYTHTYTNIHKLNFYTHNQNKPQLDNHTKAPQQAPTPPTTPPPSFSPPLSNPLPKLPPTTPPVPPPKTKIEW